MGPRAPSRQEIIDFLARATAQAEQAEAYHRAVANPGAFEARAAQQVARDAAAMQLIELAGCAEGFTRDCGEPGTTLARFDDALRPVFKLRTAHTHPESGIEPQPITPERLGPMIDRLKTSLANLDSETLRSLRPTDVQALNGIAIGLARMEKDGPPNPAALTARDLHYAGYYHEIQFGRLAKASGLFDNMGRSPDARNVDVNASIFDADNMAHKFHAMRSGADKSILPASVVAPEHRNRVPGRTLSEITRELRTEFQTPAERLAELQAAETIRLREEYRDAVHGLATAYVDITGDPKAAALIQDYVQRHEPRLERDTLEAMREALHAAARPTGTYAAMPEAVRNNCVGLSLALDTRGDSRLLNILDAAEARVPTQAEKLAAIERQQDAEALSRAAELTLDLTPGPKR